MIYDYQYSLVAVVATAFLILLTFQRRGYPTARNKIFIHLLFCNLLLTLADIFTFFTISFPENYSLPVLYLSNMAYVILFGVMTCSFFYYAAHLIEGSRYTRLCRNIFCGIITVESILTLSTYWTHWIIYFDDNLVYRHGPLFFILYIFPVFMLLVTVTGFYSAEAHLRHMKRSYIAGLSFFGIFMASLQIIIPKFDSLTCTFAFILFLLYASCENPSHYTYQATRCYNYRAFYKACEDMQRKGENPEIVLLGILNHSRNHGIQEMAALGQLMSTIADKLFRLFRHRVFCISDGKFLIVAGEKDSKKAGDTAGAAQITEKLNAALSQPVRAGDSMVQISCRTRSFRFMDLAVSDDFIDHLIESFRQTSMDRLFLADHLSQIIKDQHEYRELEDILSNAIREDKFRVFYQPIYHVRTHRFKSAEALMRLTDDSGTGIPPGLLADIAEKNGSIVELGEMIFEKVCRFWTENNLAALGLEYVEVNISPVQLEQKDMASRFIDIMEKYSLSPSCINLEILETAFQASNKNVEKNISILKKYGLHFSIDDYGSGFASTNYLFRFPISLVKIDQSILRQAAASADGEKIFRRTLDLINELDKGIVVEGAENEKMVRLAEEAGAHYIQGYYFSKPVPGEEFIAFLAEKNKPYLQTSVDMIP